MSGTCTPVINLRYQDGSEGSRTNPAKFNNQDYAQLKANYLSRGKLFVDRTFPPDNRSLGDLPDMSRWQEDQVQWLRPADILKAQNNSADAAFIFKGASRFDFGQGSFWRYGKWVDVVIDDYLPTLNNQLLSVRSTSGNEFWGPLLEKAYAKVCGSYADMNAGLPSEACKDFCGGVHMTYQLRQDKLVNTVAHTGLVDAHAYSVTAVTEVKYYGSKVKLVRIMNPWGRQEWNGKWSDKMELEDFCHYFNMLSICCENPNFLDGDLTCKWKCMVYNGSWIAGKSAGGNLGYSSFATNPQFRIQVTKINKEEEEDKNILISLMQKPLAESRIQASRKHFPIGITVFKTPQGPLSRSFFDRNRPMKQKQMYSYLRDLIEHHSLELGEYVIIPSTMRPYQSADFVLTVYSKAESTISPHDGHDDDDHDHDKDKDKDKDNLILPKLPTDKDDDKDKDTVRALFNRYADQNGELNARQLQRLLNDNFPHGTSYGFGVDTCRSMIAIMDIDYNMRMTFVEFSKLWTKIDEYKKLFHRSDLSNNGALSDYELQKAIEAKGMDMNNVMVRLMVFRYSGVSSTTLENFIILMLRLEKGSDVFKDKSSDGIIHLTWDEAS
ncbi:hypothetical protein PAMP_007097 [Pampus punctatissimus]